LELTDTFQAGHTFGKPNHSPKACTQPRVSNRVSPCGVSGLPNVMAAHSFRPVTVFLGCATSRPGQHVGKSNQDFRIEFRYLPTFVNSMLDVLKQNKRPTMPRPRARKYKNFKNFKKVVFVEPICVFLLKM